MDNRVSIIDLSGQGCPLTAIIAAADAAREGDDIVISVRPGPDGQEPTLRPDPAPGGGGSWFIWG